MADNRIIRRLFHIFWLLKRPMTLGVRVLVTRERKEVLLVEHTYVSGWFLPGGGVETGETAPDAAKKELLEETGVCVLGALKLVGVFHNRGASRRDHVVLYECHDWSQDCKFKPNGEIRDCRFFPLDQLPENTTGATRRRIMEFSRGLEADHFW